MSRFAFVVLLVSSIYNSATAVVSLDATKWSLVLAVTLTISRCAGIHINGSVGGDGIRQRSFGDGYLLLLQHAASALRSSYGHPLTANIDRVAAAATLPPYSSSPLPSHLRVDPTELAQDALPGRSSDGGYVSMPYLVSGYREICNNNNNDNNDQAFPSFCTLPYMVTHPHTPS